MGTVFLHFPTMARLAETLLDETVESALATAREDLPASGLVDQLVHVSTCLYDAYWVDPDLSRQVISASVFEADPQGPSSRRMADFRSWVTRLADDAVTAGALPPIPGDEVFAGFFALYFGVLVSGLRGEVDRATQPAVLRTLLARFLKGGRRITDALVVGGGIGGLTAALALAQEGHRVTVVEQAPRFEAAGSGIVMAPNAVHVLRRVGVDLTRIGQVIARSEVRPATGRVWFVADVAGLAGSDGPTFALPRPALHKALVEALPASVAVVHGRRVEAVEPVAWPTARAHVSRSAGERPLRHVDVVFGADGLRSPCGRWWSGPPAALLGTTCWRGFTPWSGGATAVEAWGTGTRVGVVPTGGGSAYYYLVRSASQGDPGPAEVSTIRSWFAGYEGVAGRVIEALEAVPPLHHDLIELDRPVWGSGGCSSWVMPLMR